MTNFEKQIRKLFVVIKNRVGNNLDYICIDNNAKFKDISHAIEYIMSIDDANKITVLNKENKILGSFYIEPANYNYDILDIVYDYTDNDFCKNIMDLLK